MLEVRVSPSAERDLADAADAISNYSLASAEKLASDFWAGAKLHARFPGLGRRREEFGQGLKSFVVRDHVVIFRVTPTAIEIVRALFGRRDLVAAFGQSEE